MDIDFEPSGCKLSRAHHLLIFTLQHYSYNAHLHIRLCEALHCLEPDKGPTTCSLKLRVMMVKLILILV